MARAIINGDLDETEDNILGRQCTLKSCVLTNASATVPAYVKIYLDVTGNVTVGTTVAEIEIGVAALSTVEVDLHSTPCPDGCSWAATLNPDTDATAPNGVVHGVIFVS